MRRPHSLFSWATSRGEGPLPASAALNPWQSQRGQGAAWVSELILSGAQCLSVALRERKRVLSLWLGVALLLGLSPEMVKAQGGGNSLPTKLLVTGDNRFDSRDFEQPFTQVSAGWGTNLGLRTDGAVVAWGSNFYGQALVPAGLSQVKSVCAGGTFSLALKMNGTVVAWGSNLVGLTNMPIGLTGVTALAAGWDYAVALKSDGTLVSWGNSRNLGRQVPAELSGITAISAKYSHTLALKQDGTVVTWGLNTDAELAVPAGLSGVTAVAAGVHHSVALKADGTVVVWGSSSYELLQMPAGLSDVVAISAGQYHTLAMKADGTLVAWGGVATRDINGTPTNYYYDSKVPEGLTGLQSVSTGAYHNTGLKSDGTLVSWGVAESLSYTASLTPSDVAQFRTLVSSDLNTAALKEDGTSAGWGGGSPTPRSQVGRVPGITAIATSSGRCMGLRSNGRLSFWPHSSYAELSSLTGVLAIGAGHQHFLVVKSDRTVVSYGFPNQSVLDVPAGLTDVTAVAGGANHSVALKADGTVVAWGSNDSNQITVPVGLTNVVEIAASYSHTLALKRNGQVVAWGRNDYGQTSVPANLSGVVAIRTAKQYSVAVKADGTLVTWGTVPSSPSAALPDHVPGLRSLALADGCNSILYSSQPLRITAQPVSQRVVNGQTVVLGVTAQGISLSYQWYEGVSGDTSAPIVGAVGRTFTTPELTTNAAYWVRVSHSLAVGDSATAVLEVSAGPLEPTFNTQPQSQLVRAGESVIFDSLVTGTPDIFFQWQQGTKNVPMGTAMSLTRTDLKTTDAGLYSLRGTNPVGVRRSAEASLGVIALPPAAAQVTLGGTATLTASVSLPAGATAQYEWRCDGEPLTEGGRYSGTASPSLKIADVQVADVLPYSCEITMVTPTVTLSRVNGETTLFVVQKPQLREVDWPVNFANARVGQRIDFQLSADYLPTKFTVMGLPPGLKVDTATGRIYGLPTVVKLVRGVASPFTLKISASNAVGTSVVRTVLWTIEPFYPAAVGTFSGLVNSGPINQALGGAVKVVVTSSGAYTGTLKMGAATYPLRGTLTYVGPSGSPLSLLTIARRSPLTPLVVSFQINVTSRQLEGSADDAAFDPVSFTAYAPRGYRNATTDAYVGSYNTAIAPPWLSGPEGNGYLVMKVSPTGALTWTGKLADGTAITGSETLNAEERLPFYHSLYANTGRIQGWLRLNALPKTLTGQVEWFKMAQATTSTTRLYKAGIPNTLLSMRGALYVKPLGPVLGLRANVPLNARVWLVSVKAGFPNDASQLVTVSMPHKVTVGSPNPYGLKLTVVPSTGVFSGSVVLEHDDPTDSVAPIAKIKRTVNYSGLLVTGAGLNQGLGFFIIDELPFMEPHPVTRVPRRVTLTPQWSGLALFEARP